MIKRSFVFYYQVLKFILFFLTFLIVAVWFQWDSWHIFVFMNQ